MLYLHLSLIRNVADQLNIEFIFFFDGCADVSVFVFARKGTCENYVLIR